MPRDLARKAESMRLWRQRNKWKIRQYEQDYKARRYRLARIRHHAKPEQAAKQAAAAKAWRARNAEWLKNFYRENLHHYTGNGKWSTRSVKGRRALREWAKTMAANRTKIEARI